MSVARTNAYRMKTSAENMDNETGAKHPEKVLKVLCSEPGVLFVELFMPPNST